MLKNLNGDHKISNSTPWNEDLLEVKETDDRRVLKSKNDSNRTLHSSWNSTEKARNVPAGIKDSDALLHYTVGIPAVWATFHNWLCA